MQARITGILGLVGLAATMGLADNHIKDGYTHPVTISYDGATLVIDSEILNEPFVVPLDLMTDPPLLTDIHEPAWVGMTSGQGAVEFIADVLTWEYESAINDIEYDDFTDVSTMNILGVAYQRGDRLCLMDSPGSPGYDSGAAWHVDPVEIGTGFDTSFVFQVTDLAVGADGFAFVIQLEGPDAIGGNGFGLGYRRGDTEGVAIPRTLGIEFDAWPSEWIRVVYIDASRNENVLAQMHVPQPCARVDLAAPYGNLSTSDICRFIMGFLDNDPRSDLVDTFDVFDLSDVNSFIAQFMDGCP